MKRPLALIGLTAMLVLAVCFYTDLTVMAVIAVVAAVGFIASIVIKRLRKEVSLVVFFATVMLAVVGFNLFTSYCVTPEQEKYHSEEFRNITATLCEPFTYDESRYYYRLQAESIDGEEADIKLTLFTKDVVLCDVGDRLTFSAYLYSTDYSGSLADGYYYSAYLPYDGLVDVEDMGENSLLNYIAELKEKISRAFCLELKYDNASLANAVLLGDKSGFSKEIEESIRKAGISHIAVVSGLHLSIITMFYHKSIGKCIKNKYINAATTVVLVLFFLTLTGFGKSSIRAAIMLFVLTLAGLFNRESDSVNSLGLAAILLIIANPYVVGDVGVLLSFSATFGIVAFSIPLEKFLTKGLLPVEESWYKRTNKLLRNAAKLFSTTFTAVLATLPVTILFFGKVSLVQIASNMIIVPMVKYFMIFAALTAAFHYISHFELVTGVVAGIADLIGTVMLSITDFFASLPMAYVKADYTFIVFWIFASLGLFALIHLLRRKGRGLRFLCGLFSLLILVSGGIAQTLVYSNTATLYIMPSDSGNMIVLSSINGNSVISCSGTVKDIVSTLNVLEALYSDNRLMVVASTDCSASKNAEDILSSFDYEKILMYDTDDGSEHAENVKALAEDITYAYGDFSVKLWDNAKLSLIMHGNLVYQYLNVGSTSVLILPYLGDVEHIPEDMRNVDVLITSGIVGNMELLSFKTLIANGDDFQRAAVIDYFRQYNCNKVSVSETITFDIVG